MKPITRGSIVGLALLGLGASLISLFAQYQLLRNPDVTGTFDPALGCDALYRSQFGLFQGVPVSLGGVIWFAVVLLLTLAAGSGKPQATRTGAASYLFVLSIAATSIVLVLSYASIFVLGIVCLPCVLASLAVVGIFFAAGAAADIPLSQLPGQLRKDARSLAAHPMALGVAIVFAVATGGSVMFFPGPKVDSAALQAVVRGYAATAFDLWFESKVRVPLDVPAEGAEVVVVKFNDYDSPISAETYRTLSPVFARYATTAPGKVKLVVKDFPLDPECNPNAGGTDRSAGCESAVAVRLAQQKQRGQAMEEWLYSHAKELTPTSVRAAAKEIGGVDDFDAQYTSTLALLARDIELGQRAEVRGTPTFFINGVRVEGGLEPQVLEQAIDHELKVAARRRSR